MTSPLPIDAILPELRETFTRANSVVLEAPPGAGKTTRVPPALLDRVPGEIWVLEPRRLAARLSAARVAEERGEKLGETVGYQVRFDERVSERTRLRFVTEAILTRRLLGDPTLRGISAVILDEFHERHIHSDVGLALLRRAQRSTRPDLKLVVMSATLDMAPLARFLDAPVVRAEGRVFPVELVYAPSEQPLPQQIAAALRRVTKEDGDVLVFLPGAADIRRAIDAARNVAGDALLLPLYGELSAEEQDRAVRRAAQRKIVFATNVAETSITIDGVGCVIDSGLAKQAAHAPWSGLPTLKVAKIAQASAIQRAGRAGRTRAGRCIRLYSEHDFRTRPQFQAAEIARIDLADTALMLAGTALEWFEAPPAAAWRAANDLLTQLGALQGGAITALGLRMRQLPLHPRQARLALAAEALGAGESGCALAALLSERDVRVDHSRHVTSSDLLPLLEAFERGDHPGLRGVARVRDQIRRIVRPRADKGDRERALLEATLCAFPDRVARVRTGARGEPQVVFAQGGHGTLARESAVHGHEWVVAVDAEERSDNSRNDSGRSAIRVSKASAIETDWLLELLTEQVEDREVAEWNDKAERVDVFRRLSFGQLIIEETRVAGDPQAVSDVLCSAAEARGGLTSFAPELEQLRARIVFVRAAGHALPLDEHTLLRALCTGKRSFADLRDENITALAEASAGAGVLRELAPEKLALPSGRALHITYTAGQAPHVSSRLQDFFGMARGPQLAGGRVPNGRDLQVTTDLAGFWKTHYPELAPALRRRYPRHSWPEDPLHAQPPVPRRR
jgi:ATP-dependent helicase HrpB